MSLDEVTTSPPAPVMTSTPPAGAPLRSLVRTAATALAGRTLTALWLSAMHVVVAAVALIPPVARTLANGGTR
jgi:hypothetical protein